MSDAIINAANNAALPNQSAVVLFDGVCHFCDASINFIYAHDKPGYFKFAALQSAAGQRLTKQYDLENVDSVILIENDRAYIRSTAALRIARRLDGVWAWFYNFIIVPKFLRDFAYEMFSRNRYLMFGKKDACSLPTLEMRQRFLDFC